MRKTFKGTYYKHQNGETTVALIAGTSAEHAFIQVITNGDSRYFRFPKKALSSRNHGKTVIIGGNIFSEKGVKINIGKNGYSIRGIIKYRELTPIKYDIMGPFKYLPMQCRHKITSLLHGLDGHLNINSERVDFTGGTGYIEGDSGSSFPKNYVWVHCNDFHGNICVTASIADIPLAGLRFRGCICVVYFRGKEYRLATYLGVKILACGENRVVLKQGSLALAIDIESENGHKLLAPQHGEMVREIRECIACGARFRFAKDGQLLFDLYSKNTSFECVCQKTA